MANTGPPKPRLWPAGDPTTDADRLTVPQAWQLYSGILGYHLPKRLNNAGKLSQALAQVRQVAQSWTIVTQYPDVETDGGQFARDVMVVGTVTGAHGVYFERRYPRATFSESIAQSDANGFTIVFEDLFAIAGVEAVTWGQRLNAANQLVDFVTVYYTSTSGESSNFVEVPFRQLTQAFVAGRVKAGRAVLDANEGA